LVGEASAGNRRAARSLQFTAKQNVDNICSK